MAKKSKSNEFEFALTKDMIIKILQNLKLEVADDAKITVRVPGGADWSNMDLNIGNTHDDSDSFIMVKWTY